MIGPTGSAMKLWAFGMSAGAALIFNAERPPPRAAQLLRAPEPAPRANQRDRGVAVNGQQIDLGGAGRGICRCQGRLAGTVGVARSELTTASWCAGIPASRASCRLAGSVPRKWSAHLPSTAGSSPGRVRVDELRLWRPDHTRTSARAPPAAVPAANLAAVAIASMARARPRSVAAKVPAGKPKNQCRSPISLGRRPESSAVRHPSLTRENRITVRGLKNQKCEHESQQAHLPLDAVIDHRAICSPGCTRLIWAASGVPCSMATRAR